MEEKIKKESKFIDNVAYKNKFQFLMWVNDNVICQRYFKINGYNEESLYSEEFARCMNSIVRSIQEDMKSKSRIFMWYTDTASPIKLTGFLTDEEIERYGTDFFSVIADSRIKGDVEAPDGKIIHKEYAYYGENEEIEAERPSDGEIIFKFSFLIDGISVYEKVWDCNVYPKFIRNGVDLTNSYATYKNDISSLNFGSAIIRRMQIGKTNLISDFIRRICETLSNSYIAKENYTKELDEYKINYYIDKEKYNEAVKLYGVVKPCVTGHTDIKEESRNYTYYSNFESYKHSWEKSVRKKTQEYFNTMYPSNRQIEYIERHY